MEGRQEGELSGIQRAKAEVARNMLRKGFDIGFILEITDLTQSQFNDLGVDRAQYRKS